MDTRDTNRLGAFELRMIDADISHLRLAIAAVVQQPNSALPLLYWRKRLERLLRSRHLTHHQFSAVTGLLSRLAKNDDDPASLELPPEPRDEQFSIFEPSLRETAVEASARVSADYMANDELCAAPASAFYSSFHVGNTSKTLPFL